jgi:hypothetical protein
MRGHHRRGATGAVGNGAASRPALRFHEGRRPPAGHIDRPAALNEALLRGVVADHLRGDLVDERSLSASASASSSSSWMAALSLPSTSSPPIVTGMLALTASCSASASASASWSAWAFSPPRPVWLTSASLLGAAARGCRHRPRRRRGPSPAHWRRPLPALPPRTHRPPGRSWRSGQCGSPGVLALR